MGGFRYKRAPSPFRDICVCGFRRSSAILGGFEKKERLVNETFFFWVFAVDASKGPWVRDFGCVGSFECF